MTRVPGGRCAHPEAPAGAGLDRLVRLEPTGRDSRMAVLRDGRRLPVSRSGYARLQELL